MARFIVRRFLNMFVMLVLVSVFIFVLSRTAGDPRDLYLGEGIYTTKENYDLWGKEMGLDKPIPIQYLVWASKALKGDFGESLVERISAWQVIRARIPVTLELALPAFGWALLLGVSMGVLTAVRRGSKWDLAGRLFALAGQALPGFWVGILSVLFFAVYLGWLPTFGAGSPKHLVLPSLTLGWAVSASTMRLVRSSMLDVLDSEYIKFARAKGVSTTWVVWKHAIRNAMIAPITHMGLILAGFITGTAVTEIVFARQGLGRLAVQATLDNDFSVIVGVVMFTTVVFVIANLLVDVLYVVIDPRIRYT